MENAPGDTMPYARRVPRPGQGLVGRRYSFARRAFSDSGVRAGEKGYWRQKTFSTCIPETHNEEQGGHLSQSSTRKTNALVLYMFTNKHNYGTVEKKQSRSKRRLIGRVDEQTGEIVSTRGSNSRYFRSRITSY